MTTEFLIGLNVGLCILNLVMFLAAGRWLSLFAAAFSGVVAVLLAGVA